jgi:hypothetical protein
MYGSKVGLETILPFPPTKNNILPPPPLLDLSIHFVIPLSFFPTIFPLFLTL